MRMAKPRTKLPSTVAKPRATPTRQKLVEAAHRLIWANSYAHVSVDDICREAGVQKGSFYHFFPTKADLAAAALEDYRAEVEPKLEAIFASDKSPQMQLKSLAQEILKKQQEALAATGKVCGCPYATMGAELSGSHETLRRLCEEFSQHFCGYFEQLLRHAARAGLISATGIKERAREMHIYVIGALLQARIANRLDSVGKPLEVALFRISGLHTKAPARTARK